MPTNSGSDFNGGAGNNWGTPPRGAKARFFRALRKNMENMNWRTISVPGFDWAAIETVHFDMDSLFAAFNADDTEILEGAHIKLSRWADSCDEKMPQTRIAIAVYDNATKEEIGFITKELQKGNRMGKQSMTGVIDLKAEDLFEPQEGRGPAHKRIRINKPVFEQLRSVVKVLATGY